MPSEPCVCGCVSLWGHWQHLPECPWLKAQARPAKFRDLAVKKLGEKRYEEIRAEVKLESLRERIAAVLEANDGCCLDDEEDRARVLDALMELFS